MEEPRSTTHAADALNAIIANHYDGVSKPLGKAAGLSPSQMTRLRKDDIAFSIPHLSALSRAMNEPEREAFLLAVLSDIIGPKAAQALFNPCTPA